MRQDAPVAQVDPSDDSIRRYIVMLNAYSEERGERGAWPVAAFDNETEFLDYIHRHSAELDDVQSRGLGDPRDHYSGTVKEPGHDANTRLQRWRGKARRAATRGITQRL